MSDATSADGGVAMTLDELRALARGTLRRAGLAPDHADAVAETMVAGERDGCASHGIYRLLVAANSIRAGDAVTGHLARAEALFARIEEQGARLPSARRYAARCRSLARGVTIPAALHADIMAIGQRA